MSFIKIIIIFSFFCSCFSCTYEKAELNKECTPPETVSYSQHIQPIFNSQCATAGCHSGSSPTGNLNLEASVSYSQLSASGSGYLDTINPKFSVLYAQMNSVSNPMPPSGKLDKCTLELVLKWIEQKAKNN